jgi:sarcosine oxidase subunit alpha
MRLRYDVRRRSPVVHHNGHIVAASWWDAAQVMFRPGGTRTDRHDGQPFVITAGIANGHLYTAEAIGDGWAAGRAAAKAAGRKQGAQAVKTMMRLKARSLRTG